MTAWPSGILAKYFACRIALLVASVSQALPSFLGAYLYLVPWFSTSAMPRAIPTQLEFSFGLKEYQSK